MKSEDVAVSLYMATIDQTWVLFGQLTPLLNWLIVVSAVSDKEGAPRPKPEEPSFIFEVTLAKKRKYWKNALIFLMHRLLAKETIEYLHLSLRQVSRFDSY